MLLTIEDGGDGPGWVAQCLEHDVAAQAASPAAALDELQRLIVGRWMAARRLGVDPFAGLQAAPREFWEAFASAGSLETKHDSLTFASSEPMAVAMEPRFLARVA
ncbi:MAG: hypothetical protein HYV07_12870 [Deltaproteobacteria bacterium]|nr:hypothetical protein [Deltaproteobacteria bacterium]